MLDGLAHRVLGDLVEEDAADLRRLAAEEVHHVPADGLALAVGVGGNVDEVGLLGGRFQLANDLLFPFEDLVFRLERHLVDAELALRQVAHVTDRSLHDVVLADELVDRLRFRGRLDDDEVLGHCGAPN